MFEYLPHINLMDQMVPLHPHPASPPQADIAVSVQFAFVDAGGGFWFEFQVEGEVDRLVLLDENKEHGGREDGLWKHSCAELFIIDGDGPEYVEFNFSFNHQWAAYRFTGFRKNQRDLECETAPLIGTGESEGVERLFAQIPLQLRPDPNLVGDWRVSPTMVIEEQTGHKSYWALAHGYGAPDFHQRDCFLGLV